MARGYEGAPLRIRVVQPFRVSRKLSELDPADLPHPIPGNSVFSFPLRILGKEP
jgi:hypothetical protein